MNWYSFRGVSINIGRFVFYDKNTDGTAALCTPRGHVCFLNGDHRQGVDRLMAGYVDEDRDCSVHGLAWPGGDGPWVKVSGGAVNMALADLVDTNEERRIAVHGGIHTRVYTGEDVKAIMAWLRLNELGDRR
jgi:hypothetical protein